MVNTDDIADISKSCDSVCNNKDITSDTNLYKKCLKCLDNITKSISTKEASLKKDIDAEHTKELAEVQKEIAEITAEHEFKINQIQLDYNNFFLKELTTYIPLTYISYTLLSTCYFIMSLFLIYLFVSIFVNIQSGNTNENNIFILYNNNLL